MSETKPIRMTRLGKPDGRSTSSKKNISKARLVVKDALKNAGSVSGAAKLLDCAKITIIRRQQMWAEGRKLQLPIGLGLGGIGHGRMHSKQTKPKNRRKPINV